MSTTINFDALSALSRVALESHVPEERRAMLGRMSAMDRPDMDDIARTLTSSDAVLDNDHTLGDTGAYELGFNFALRLGAILATSPPLVTPDLTELISEFRERTANWARNSEAA